MEEVPRNKREREKLLIDIFLEMVCAGKHVWWVALTRIKPKCKRKLTSEQQTKEEKEQMQLWQVNNFDWNVFQDALMDSFKTTRDFFRTYGVKPVEKLELNRSISIHELGQL